MLNYIFTLKYLNQFLVNIYLLQYIFFNSKINFSELQIN